MNTNTLTPAYLGVDGAAGSAYMDTGSLNLVRDPETGFMKLGSDKTVINIAPIALAFPVTMTFWYSFRSAPSGTNLIFSLRNAQNIDWFTFEVDVDSTMWKLTDGVRGGSSIIVNTDIPFAESPKRFKITLTDATTAAVEYEGSPMTLTEGAQPFDF